MQNDIRTITHNNKKNRDRFSNTEESESFSEIFEYLNEVTNVELTAIKLQNLFNFLHVLKFWISLTLSAHLIIKITNIHFVLHRLNLNCCYSKNYELIIFSFSFKHLLRNDCDWGICSLFVVFKYWKKYWIIIAMKYFILNVTTKWLLVSCSFVFFAIFFACLTNWNLKHCCLHGCNKLNGITHINSYLLGIFK